MYALRGNPILTILAMLALLVGLVTASIHLHSVMMLATKPATCFMFGWLCLAIIFAGVSLLEFVPGFLISVFSMIIAWRIAGLLNVRVVSIPLTVAFIFLLLNFLYCAYKNLSDPQHSLQRYSLMDWQLIFIRLYVGLDFIPHFTEKLFAGAAPHMEDVKYFAGIHVPHPDFFVWLAGFCELGAAITLGLGLFMRLGTVGAMLYLLIATLLGGHFLFGFIWANTGGGWEFPVFWMVLMLTFAVTGYHKFSLDQFIEDRVRVPSFLKRLL